jgi:transcriptional regulator GlxA family with amidase domain
MSVDGDKDDEWTARIDEAFPTSSGSHEEYATALRMVGNRHSKAALVALVNWLLVEKKRGER